MIRHTILSIFAFAPILALSSTADAGPSLARALAIACESNEADCDAPQKSLSAAISRRVLVGDIVEYSVDLRVGPGSYDVIGLHRVVRESAPNVPAPTSKAIMMVHGDAWDFEAAFLAAGPSPDGASLPVHLASNGIDVWGIDLGWTRVPASEANLSFMQNWGFQRDVRDIGTALGVARVVRALSGQGHGRLHLLGWSRGGQLAYAYAGAESQRPPGLRHVGGLIPVDIYLETDDPDFRAGACQRRADERALVASGQYANNLGGSVGPLGFLAQIDPTGPSPAFPGLDNEHAAMTLGAATFLLMPQPPVPSYHLTGGLWDAAGVQDLAYADPAVWFDVLARAKPWQPWAMIADADAATCDDPQDDVPFDDHLADITVPTFYVGAGGGFGAAGIYTTSLLGSQDVSNHVVQHYPEEYRLLDIGHTDIFQGYDAETLFWEPIRSWITAH
ncbi:hypothetical protein [Polyangium mundeleinium]|uniref:AB hydrolase-1 domain-containing protein n=1 Tax=Polyangium mundeleinium TaxID=2995306 RepID=A0ABT5EII5_9BACT|nr:hypothetical protein [Polyangium mundeleinium]MDC0741623.1 hypothetical protein [Polyangium mundeleinium]